MTLFHSITTASFYALTVGILITALLTVTVRNLFHVAIFLAFTLLGIAMIFFFLHADFLAAVQVLLYVGAIMTLVIFAIMLTSRIGDPIVPQSNRQGFPTLIALIALAAGLIPIILKAPWKLAQTPQATTAGKLGQALMGEFVFPFEVVSLVLLIALIGAVVISRSDEAAK